MTMVATAVVAKQIVILLFTVWLADGSAKPGVMTAPTMDICRQNAPFVLAQVAMENPGARVSGGCFVDEAPPDHQ